jgi:FkbM family methyltransferase
MSYSLSNSKGEPMDLLLDNIFNKSNGFFIELGAFDGLNFSNTAYFEFSKGWKGILIEPSKKSYELCVKNRPNSIVYNVCCVSNSFKEEYIEGDFYDWTMSSVQGLRLQTKELVKVSAKTLENILDECHTTEIDFLSLDTEGYEYNVLEGLNLDKYRPKYMLIEIYYYDYNKIIDYLQNKKYCLHSNFSNLYDLNTWDGTHNDFLFQAI